ncbi:ESX secretion-associated protein EspG [Prauserella oleivorans]|uniref:ESX secretion-associated protein EspG n=1 Tax=Prauserella oleivorans TaxID=1478153 RepID=A0ABW5W6P0_9PSEU
MPVLRGPVDVPRPVLLHTWGVERLGDPHPVLGSFGYYVPQDAVAELTRQCLRLLAELGLATGDSLTREFRDTLRTLAQPGRELYCWSSFADPEQDRACLVAERDGEAVELQVQGDVVSIGPADSRRLVEAFVASLPDVPAARVRPLTVDRAEFEQRGETGLDDPLAQPGAADELAKQLQAPRDAVHQLYGAVTSDGRRRRSRPMSAIDVSGAGRVLVLVDGHDRLHRLPGTPGVLAETLVATWQSM